jgi:hypothetical protein
MKQIKINSDLKDKNLYILNSNKINKSIYYNKFIILLALLFIFFIFFNYATFQNNYKNTSIKIESHMNEIL